MEWWKAVTCFMARVGLLAGFLLLVHLRLLLMLGVVPRWFSCAFLARAGCAGYVPIPRLRVLLRCQAGWSWFSEWRPFFLASYVFGARGTLLGWTLTAHTFLRHHGRRGQPRAFVNVPLHLLTWWGYSTKAGPACEIQVVMHADNVVEVDRIILDGVHAEWATQHAWLVPILGFIRPVDRDASKCAPRMQFLQQPQWGNGAPWNTTMIYGCRCIFVRSRRLLTCSIVTGGFRGASIDTFAESTW